VSIEVNFCHVSVHHERLAEILIPAKAEDGELPHVFDGARDKPGVVCIQLQTAEIKLRFLP
jgi:hypothetical protein